MATGATGSVESAWRRYGAAAGVCGIALLVGWLLSQATGRVMNWFVMTDELYYERLGIAVAQTGSVLPRIHGELVANLNQLYPALLGLVYGEGDVPGSLAAAHRLNAFVMASAAIPVYLLARRINVGRPTSMWIAGLAVATPWMVLSSFLLTEVVAYPAFCWCLLVLCTAVSRKSSWWDLACLASIGVAVLARAQFAVFVFVLALAVVSEALIESAEPRIRGRALPRRLAIRSVIRTRPVLVVAYTVGVVGALLAFASGNLSRLLGVYATTAGGIRIDPDLFRLAVAQLGPLALATGILPLAVGGAWLVDRLRPTASGPERALALVGTSTVILLGLQVASFNQRFGAGLVKDRYLFYVVPVFLVAMGAALSARSWPTRMAFLPPVALIVASLILFPIPVYEKLNVDSPAAILNDEILRLSGSVGWAHVLLPLLAIVVVGVFVEANVYLGRRVAAVSLVALATLVLPGGAVYAFDRLFAVNGTNGLPVTLDQGVVFNWVDRAVGKDGRVTMFRYPVSSPDWWAGQAYWWDAEFWNESVVRDVRFEGGSRAEPSWTRAFDRRTGVMAQPESTRFVLVHGSDVRFRLAGRQVIFDRSAYVVEPDVPWRAEWLTSQIYADGWTLPHAPARIRVFAKRGQRTSLTRFLTVSITSPKPWEPRPLSIRSNLDSWRGSIPAPGGSIDRLVSLCVPQAGYADVEIETPYVSDVYRDPTRGALTGETDRPVGVLLRSFALANETVAVDGCPS